jgi:hypothetical protein
MAPSVTITAMRKEYLIALVLVTLTGVALSCVTAEERRQPLKEVAPPHIDKLSPSATLAGQDFQVQPSGDSAIAVTGSNFVSGSRIYFNGRPLSTAFGGSTGLTAIVPAELYRQPGGVEVTVENGDGQRSNAVLFQVLPASGPAPQISRLLPDASISGQSFNVQRDGESALVVKGANFTPGAAVYFGGTPLTTAYSDAGTLTASVPAHLLRTTRAVRVYVRNPDGKTSESLRFAVVRRVR